jgi:hypothetical protein
MELLTQEVRKALPPLYSQEAKGLDATVHVKFFGYVVSPLGPDCDELGYFSLSELQELRFPPYGLPIERDLYFTPTALRDVMQGHS